MSSSTSTPAALPPPSTATTQPRKFPLPCWTHEETVALIDAYRERWLSLRRGYLRTVDWEAVASTVASICEHVVSPTKSSDQCRHKIEKLRQRFRAEKQRSVAAFPGKFVSGWIFYKGLSFLDGVEKKRGLEDKVVSGEPVADMSNGDFDDGFFLTALGDRKFTIDVKNFMKGDEKTQTPDFGIRRNTQFPVENIPTRSRKFARMEMPNHSFNGNDEVNDKIYFHKGFVRSENTDTPARYPVEHSGRNMIFDVDQDGGFNFSHGVSGKLHSSMAREKTERINYGNSNNSLNEDSGREGKDPLAEIAECIKQMGVGFLRMEKMRMEMALEFEKARMEMELKRNEMIIESQKRMVEAFVNAAKINKLKK